MYLGINLQFLRRQHGNMTQERLAEQMGVARQTVSKWESGESAPDVQKLIELCDMFSCSLDSLLRQDMTMQFDIYAPVRIERVQGFHYAGYTVISKNPESDSLNYLSAWADRHQYTAPTYIGWRFPYISQDQKHRFGLRGYVSAVILQKEAESKDSGVDHASQEDADYAVMTIRDPHAGPSDRISQAYDLIIAHLNASGIKKKHTSGVLPCFERVYTQDGSTFMDVYVHCHNPGKPDMITNFQKTQEV